MVTIKKSLSSKKRNDGVGQEILFRLSVARGKVFRVKSNLFINPKYWDDKKGKIVIPRIHVREQKELIELQKTLNDLSTFIIERCIETSDTELTKEWLERTVHIFYYGEDESEIVTQEEFYAAMELFIKLRVKPGPRERQFKCIMRMLKRFELFCGKGYKLTLDGMTDIDLCRFEKFLSDEHTFFNDKGKCIKHANIYKKFPEKRVPKPRELNRIHIIMKKIRTFYNWAIKTGRTKNNPFTRYRMPTSVYGNPFYITIDERNKLFAHDFSNNPQLAIQRDIFVFQSCIGIRTGDLYNLTRNNVVGKFIEYIANKTLNENGNTLRVPLIPQAITILKRYEDANRKELLPFISRQHYNKAIKEMLKEAGITRVVTILNPTTRQNEQHPIYEVASSYMARRNFIGNLYKEVKDADLIGCMTGHTEGSRAFSRYRSIDDDIKKSVIAKLE